MPVVNHKSEDLCAQSARTRTINQLLQFATPQTPKQERVLREFSQHLHGNPALAPFLVRHLRKQVRKFGWACFDAAWCTALVELHTPGGPEFKLCAKLKAWYVRGLIYCHSELLNGDLELRVAAPDAVFGMRVSDKKLPDEYGCRLEWADGTALSEPHPAVRAVRKPVQSVRPTQGKLFEVTA